MTAVDPHSNASKSIIGPFEDAKAVTPSDSADLATVCRGLLLSADANVKVTTAMGTTLVMPLQKGYNPGRFSRVWATGGDVSLPTMVALY